MPLALNNFGLATCDHATGVVALAPSQTWVRAEGGLLLIGNDPARKGIGGCTNAGPTIKPCTSTLNVEQGQSAFVRIDGKAVCLQTVVGGTDGTPPGATKYRVRQPGQTLVTIDG